MSRKIITISLLTIVLIFSFTFVANASKIYNVTLNNVDKKPAIDLMLDEIMSNGFNIISANDYQLLVKKDADDFWVRVFYGSRFNSTPEIRMNINFVQLDNNTRVAAEAKIVTNPNSAYEKSQPIENNEIQKMLDRFKNNAEKKYGKKTSNEERINSFGFIYATGLIDGCIFVSQITPGSVAEKTGLSFGDKICKLDDRPIFNVNEFSNELKDRKTIKLTWKSMDGKETTSVLNLP